MRRDIYNDYITAEEMYATNIQPPRRYIDAVKGYMVERAGCHLREVHETPIVSADILTLSVRFDSSRWTGRS